MRNPKKWRFGSVLAGLMAVFLLIACQGMGQTNLSQTPTTPTSPGNELSASPAELPPLPYPYNALEPHIDAQTMELHHDKHHASYVSNLNKALENNSNLQNQSVEALIRNLNQVPENIRTAVRNNGGGHVNHSMFWEIMSPNGGGEPTGAIAQAINDTFGSFETFKEQFNQAGTRQFGSGWVWLVRNAQGQLEITSTPNQDSPLMDGQYPIMGNDVWEHAYYLNYQNQRGEYLTNWWNVVNWEEVNRRFERASQAS
ncbi:superoxide dismutase [Laspinema sp. D1]|uniref:Superoxide dismutase n=1 Tax=Laspinema palackyanum D2a TaxID=2953684 RepID=A0ABT2MNE6_9CYAN|nr:superoxide dismutase [Laspinema sp. D2a]